jgi:hypothetical protein
MKATSDLSFSSREFRPYPTTVRQTLFLLGGILFVIVAFAAVALMIYRFLSLKTVGAILPFLLPLAGTALIPLAALAVFACLAVSTDVTYGIGEHGLSSEVKYRQPKIISWDKIAAVATRLGEGGLFLVLTSSDYRPGLLASEACVTLPLLGGQDNHRQLEFLAALMDTPLVTKFDLPTTILAYLFVKGRRRQALAEGGGSGETGDIARAYKALAEGNFSKAKKHFSAAPHPSAEAADDWVRLQYATGGYSHESCQQVLVRRPENMLARAYLADVRMYLGNQRRTWGRTWAPLGWERPAGRRTLRWDEGSPAPVAALDEYVQDAEAALRQAESTMELDTGLALPGVRHHLDVGLPGGVAAVVATAALLMLFIVRVAFPEEALLLVAGVWAPPCLALAWSLISLGGMWAQRKADNRRWKTFFWLGAGMAVVYVLIAWPIAYG